MYIVSSNTQFCTLFVILFVHHYQKVIIKKVSNYTTNSLKLLSTFICEVWQGYPESNREALRTKGGKSNSASCAYTAEQVFTRPGKSSLYPRSKLCNVDDVWSGTDYKNFIVDFKSNTVSQTYYLFDLQTSSPD